MTNHEQTAPYHSELEPTRLGYLVARTVLGLADGLTMVQGIVQETAVPDNEDAHTLGRIANKVRLIAAHAYGGSLRDVYARYEDTRVTRVDDEGVHEGSMTKVRTCDLDPEPYDPLNTGHGTGRTRLGRLLSQTWLDELPQLISRSKDDHLAISLVGVRPRKRQDFAYIPVKLRTKDNELYSLGPKGLIDPDGILRKQNGSTSDMAQRAACDIAYGLSRNGRDYRVVDSALVYATIDHALPRKVRRTAPIARRMLPLLVKNLVPLSRAEALETYQGAVIEPANRMLIAAGESEISFAHE